MSLLAPPATFGLMFPFKAERSRNKERLESSLAALCELELLKQRQESRVLSALCLGDCGTAPGRTAWMALRAPARCATDAQDSDAPEYGLRLQTVSCTRGDLRCMCVLWTRAWWTERLEWWEEAGAVGLKAEGVLWEKGSDGMVHWEQT